jgi:AAA domain
MPNEREDITPSHQGNNPAVSKKSLADRTIRVEEDAAAPDAKAGKWRDTIVTAAALRTKIFKPVAYIIKDIIPEGVTLLAGRPKIGKSWLLMQIAINVAKGCITLVDTASPIEGDVLYLALEDNDRRLHRRMRCLCGDDETSWPGRITFAIEWRRLDQGGLDDFREWCRLVAKPVLIIIDTLKRVRPPRQKSQSDYEADYSATEGLHALVTKFPGLGVIVSHHDRKMAADDVFDTISGTLGLTAGVDTIAVIKRGGGTVTLHVEGRDLVETVEKAIMFDRESCRWAIVGEAVEVRRTVQQQRIIQILGNAQEDGMSLTEIAKLTGLSSAAASSAVYRMLGNEIVRVGRARYALSTVANTITYPK